MAAKLPPSRAAWIETGDELLQVLQQFVSALAGGVDGNDWGVVAR